MIKSKLITRDELSLLCDDFRKQGFKIGFTSGVFDFLHAGHVDYLEQAKSHCDILIVGINSDKSVKKYKGPQRPIMNEYHRCKILAALTSVDYVFIFDERRNEKNIRYLRPDIYFKAADYSIEQLTSKSVIEQLGGHVQLIPIVDKISTTEIVKKIVTHYETIDNYTEDLPGIGYFNRKPMKIIPAIFLDRDGTINKDVGYISEPEKFEFLPHTIGGMKKMYDMGYKLIIVTNQGGIGLGYFSREDFYRVNIKMLTEISKSNIKIDKIYFCPHSLAENCKCRKPEIGLLERAQQDLNIDMAHSYFIGDDPVDIETGKRAGTKTILIKSDFRSQKEINKLTVKPDFIAHDLLEAANIVLAEDRK